MSIPKMVKLMAQFDAGQSDHHEKVIKNYLNVALRIKKERGVGWSHRSISTVYSLQTDNQLFNEVAGETLPSTVEDN